MAGWIEHLDVNTTGEFVRAGQPLAHIFSQELLSSQTEYLAARRNAVASGITSAVVASGPTRLGVLGVSSEEIDAIEQSGEPKRLVTVVAPRSGVVANRGVTVGTSVDPSTTLLTIADLSRVWVLAEVAEASIPVVRVGTTAELDFPASGRLPFTARIDFVCPTLTERTRTLRVRLSVANPGGALRPGLPGILASLSIGKYAPDAFSEGKPFFQALLDFVIHLIPMFVLLTLVVASFRWEWIGGVAFIGLAIVYGLTMSRGRLDWMLLISGPLAIVGALFLWSWFHHGKLPAS